MPRSIAKISVIKMIAFLVLLCVAGSFARPDGKIVGGQDTTIEKYPWQVSLQKASHFCGGSIIDKNWILTAAHCVPDGNAMGLWVVAGSTRWDEEGPTAQVKQVAQVIVHKDYKPPQTGSNNDIALLRLASPLDLTKTPKAVKLADSEPKKGEPVTVTGWGTTREGGQSIPSILQKVTVNMIDRATCNQEYQPTRITEQMICAEGEKKDSCQGDSGGPLVDSSNTLVGVVSFGRGCARPHLAGVYANVANLRQWIKTNSGV